MPHRDLKEQGKVVKSEGFGIFSISRGLISNPPVLSYDFLNTHIKEHNGAKEMSEIGLFNSYEYFNLDDSVYALSFDVARPLCKEPRKNGMGHRMGTHIKQCLIGSVRDYPFRWFGASVWNAHLKSENYYYLDCEPNAVPEVLPEVAENPSNGYITIDKIKSFVSDGRMEAVKAGIWFLIEEYSKLEKERKVLLIKDIPENVELWIAAIECAFSTELAEKITFTTNRTNLSDQIDSVLFYYTDGNGKFCQFFDRSISLFRHPYNMIVGYHPNDKFASVRQMPISNFVIIDGESKTFNFETGNSIRSDYYSAVVRYDDDIIDFCRVVLPSLPVKNITKKIPEIYDSYMYLFDSNHKVEKWNYEETLKALASFTEFGLSENNFLNTYILDEAMRGYQNFAAEDAKQDFVLIEKLWNISTLINREKDISACIANYLMSLSIDLKISGARLIKTWDVIKKAGFQNVVQLALKEVFGDSELLSFSNQFHDSSADTICVVMEMFFYFLKNEPDGINSIQHNKERNQFVFLGLISLIDNKRELRNVLEYVSELPELFNGMVISVSQYFNQHAKNKIETWWDVIVELCGNNVIDLCNKLCQFGKIDIETVEYLFAGNILKLGKCDRDYVVAFSDFLTKLEKNQNTGLEFYGSWIRVADASDADGIIHSIRENGLNINVERKLFKKLDVFFPYDVSTRFSSRGIFSMKQWGKDLGENSTCVELAELKECLEKEDTFDKILRKLKDFSSKKINLPVDFTTTKYFQTLVEKVAFFTQKDVHMMVLCMFNITGKEEWESFIDAYVRMALNSTKGKKLAKSVISLYEILSLDKENIVNENLKQKEMIQMVEISLKKALPDYYRSNLTDEIKKLSVGDKNIDGLIVLLQNVGEKMESKNIFGSFIKKIFRK